MCTSKMGRLKLKSLGKYRIDRKLGEGAFGDVIQGTHMLSGEKVAIKIFYKVLRAAAWRSCPARAWVRMRAR